MVILAGQLGNWFQNSQSEKGLSASRASLDDFKTIANAQQQMAEVNAGVYLTLALISSLDETDKKAARADAKKQLDGVKPVIESLAANGAMDSKVRQDVKTAMGLVDTFAKKADSAIHFAELDPNTGIAAMKRADLTFKELLTVSAVVAALLTGGGVVGQVVATMEEINTSARRISDIIGEISAAASEQSDGIGQVNTAVLELDQMTQQNAALVEESAAAADSSQAQAQRLAQVVSAFELSSRNIGLL
ncbi:MAG: hypothetical protein CFE43_20310 [Burkholderiales bacterium PBB3]|nr:MAG: hypothetical protein CFE43_20310 [Burkholderiales bacterium PBB3]